MPSLADIPEHLLHRGKLLEFLNWLILTPIPYNAKHFLASQWVKHTGRSLDREHWQYIERHSFREGI